MRVQLRRRRDERGAVAILAALLALVLLGISAFTVDLGMAYVTKRQLSAASDAASLAADAIYKSEYQGTCGTGNDPKNPTAANANVRGDAEKAADDIFTQNYPKGTSSDGSIVDVSCSGTGVQVTYSATGTSGSPFGRLLGGSGTITTAGSAAAAYTAGAATSGGIRPWGVCSNALNQTGNVTQVSLSNTQNTGCPGIGESGTWNRYACPGSSKGSTPETVTWITDGCPTPPPTTPIPNTAGLSPSDLWSYLTNYCTQGKNGASTSTCLTRDTGNVNKNKMSDAWQGLIDNKTVFQTPVFCSKPTCSADAMGSGGEFPIYALATVRICGFQLHGVTSTSWPGSPDVCSTMNPSHYTPSSTVPGGGNVMYLIFEGYTAVDGTSFGQSSPLHLSK